MEDVLALWKSKWPEARKTWNPYVKLREPIWCATSKVAKKEGLESSFAMIRLRDHRIVIDLEKVVSLQLQPYAVEILAHEIGHHIYTPANLRDNAIVMSVIRWALAGIEDRAPMVANIYEDFLINDRLQRVKALDMAAVYQKANAGGGWSKFWTLLMRTYELLWKLSRGTLAADLSQHTPNIDADASLMAEVVRSFSSNWIAGAGRFSVLLYPYLVEEKQYEVARKAIIVFLDAEKAGEDGGIVSGLAALDLEAIAGIIDLRQESLGQDTTPVTVAEVTTQPGVGPQQRYLNPGVYIDLQRQVNPNADAQSLLNAYYKEIALPHLINIPMEQMQPSSLTLPEGLETWDLGDPMEDIDWVESAIHAPQMFPGVNTVKRTYGESNEADNVKRPYDMYIGIDCSGSMTNPAKGFSWPVLAATIISISALRTGARVMACLSGEPGSYLESEGFITSEQDVLTVLTSYLGTGYAFGVGRLRKPFADPLPTKTNLLLVTDDDIFSMLDAKRQGNEDHWEVIERALQHAGGQGTLVLHSRPQWHEEDVARLRTMGWHVHYVTNEEELLVFAATYAKSNYDTV